MFHLKECFKLSELIISDYIKIISRIIIENLQTRASVLALKQLVSCVIELFAYMIDRIHETADNKAAISEDTLTEINKVLKRDTCSKKWDIRKLLRRHESKEEIRVSKLQSNFVEFSTIDRFNTGARV